MIEMLVFLAVGLILYFVADWLLQRIEIAMKHRLEFRSLVFFAILLTLALIVFPLIQRYAPG